MKLETKAFQLNQRALDNLLADSIEQLPLDWRTEKPMAWGRLGAALNQTYPANLLAGFLAAALLRLAERQPEGEAQQ